MMASREITLWLFFVSAMLVHSAEYCGLGEMSDYATWATDIGGLVFPSYRQGLNHKSTGDTDVRYCDSKRLDNAVKCNGEELPTGCHYCDEGDKVICNKAIDNSTADYLSDLSLNALVIKNMEPEVSLEEVIQREVLSIWKMADAIFSKEPPKNFKFWGLFEVTSIETKEIVIWNISIPYKDTWKAQFSPSGEAFSNEHRDGFIITLNLVQLSEMEQVKLSGEIKCIQEGLHVYISGDLYQEDGTKVEVNGTMTYKYYLSTEIVLSGDIHYCDPCFVCLHRKCQHYMIDVNISTNSKYNVFNITGSGVRNAFDYKILGEVLSDNNFVYELDIPEYPFGNASFKNIIFHNCVFSDNYDSALLKYVQGVDTVTFTKSELRDFAGHRTLLEDHKNIKALYFENDVISGDFDLKSMPVFPNLELVSFRESGPFNSTTLSWLKNSKVSYINLQHTNFVWYQAFGQWSSSILSPVANTLQYLDLSYSTVQADQMKSLFKGLQITRLSLAGLNLDSIPYDALSEVDKSLEYLTLRYNSFIKVIDNNDLVSTSIMTFPEMDNLKELDLSYCYINLIEAGAFDNLQNLERLYLSGNRIANIQDGWFRLMPPVKYLDMSHNEASASLIPIINYEGRDYEDLSKFTNLEILDLSYSKFTEVEWTLKGLSSSLIGLSVCHSNIVYKGDTIFKDLVNLQVLDLSGTLSDEVPVTKLIQFLSSLRFLYIQQSKISDHFLSDAYDDHQLYLPNLQYLSLKDNSIKVLDWNLTNTFPNLIMLDVSENSISKWNHSLTDLMPNMNVLFIHENKIDSISDLMLKDIENLQIATLGNNPFVCGCYAVNISSLSNFTADDFVNSTSEEVEDEKDFKQVLFSRSLRDLLSNFLIEHPIGILGRNSDILDRIQYRFIYNNKDNGCSFIGSSDNKTQEERGESVWLLDFDNDNYQCYSQLRKQSITFGQVDANKNCEVKQTINTGQEEIKNEVRAGIIFVSLAIAIFVLVAAGLIYWKWWYIRYFSTLVKNATVLAFMDNDDRRKRDYQYDVFVSYSDHDRPWVLNQLIPNLESQNELKVCLHERDFQVGLSILENIIACLDNSRCIFLIISKSFIKSRWCQFEMHLAQHRLLETRRDQLILIFLDDIPRIKRPRTLQYLMVTKTYIKWPKDGKDREGQMFWNRLNKSLTELDVEV